MEREIAFGTDVDAGLTARRQDGRLVVTGPGGRVLLEEAPPAGDAGLAVTRVRLRWFLVLAWWRFWRRAAPWRWASAVTESEDGGWTALGDGGGDLLKVRERSSGSVVEGEVRVPDGVAADWVRWRVRARPGERFLGFGERFNAVDQTGNKLFVWTEEGAVGLGEKLGPLLEGKPWNPFLNGPTTAYKPMPFYMSSEGYGLLIDTSARVEYDVAATDPGAVDIVVWDRGFRWFLFYGPTPAEIVERFTEHVGRATVPAPWVFAPWNDAVFGSKNVRSVAKKLRDEKIPTTAIWTEDWQGGYWLTPYNKKTALYNIFPMRYQVSRHLYPDAEEVAGDLHETGFRWLSYFLPYLARSSREFREAKEKGYLLKNKRGHVSYVLIQWLAHGHIDLTNPAARQWYMEKLEENVNAGFDGWMADFSEYVPPGSVTCSGESGLLHHNRFPLLWQQMHRELLDRLRPDGDYVFFCRSASVGSQKYVPVFWSGDSNTDFEKYDGLPSNLPAAISAGLCGLPLWAADIAGYMCTAGGRDKELFFRWTEFASLLPVMRTHHGTHPGRCWSFDSDAETIELFRRYSRLHTALFPYVFGLAHEAAATGLPAVRHLILHFPDDERAWDIDDEFLLGDRVLVAPVVARDARGRRVYFPPGDWVDYWEGEAVRGPAERWVRAPLDHLPMFVRSGSLLPTLDLPVDTLAPVGKDVDLVGWDEAVSTLRVTFYGEGEDKLTMWDGTEVRMWRAPLTEGGELERSVQVAGSGTLLEEPAADELQPAGCRARPYITLTASGEEVDIVLKDTEGRRLAGAIIKSGTPRKRVTFEWR